MAITEFITKRSRVALSWLVVIVVGALGIIAALDKAWNTVEHAIVVLGSIVGAYNISQAYTKGQFIKRAGKVDNSIAEKIIEP